MLNDGAPCCWEHLVICSHFTGAKRMIYDTDCSFEDPLAPMVKSADWNCGLMGLAVWKHAF